jgi:hypothetical protein
MTVTIICKKCQNRRFRIARRSGHNCSMIRACVCCDPNTFSHEDAAKLAQENGYNCSLDYPYDVALINTQRPAPELSDRIVAVLASLVLWPLYRLLWAFRLLQGEKSRATSTNSGARFWAKRR